jgi:ElaB/YqjD/DUF883 family membrane-anchored ribosome-binding protein
MTNDSIKQELDDLRAQFDELKAQRDAAAAKAKAEEASADQEAEPIPEQLQDEIVDEGDLAEQFQELITSLDKELKDTNPTTLIAVFALGVLIGKFLSR